jgi:hypothetical protein
MPSIGVSSYRAQSEIIPYAYVSRTSFIRAADHVPHLDTTAECGT